MALNKAHVFQPPDDHADAARQSLKFLLDDKNIAGYMFITKLIDNVFASSVPVDRQKRAVSFIIQGQWCDRSIRASLFSKALLIMEGHDVIS